MKIVTPSEMMLLEKKAYASGFTEGAFMEEAGKKIAEALFKIEKKTVWILCGKGNNGGDGLAAAFYLMKNNVEAVVIQPETSSSSLNAKNRERFLKAGGKIISHLSSFENRGVILDAFFGTGFKGEVKDPYASLICLANGSGLPIFSVDIPSGLNGETGEIETVSIQASTTYFLGLPKTGFFLGQGWNQVGHLKAIDFGIPLSLIQEFPSKKMWSTSSVVSPFLLPILRNRHKYAAGHVVGLAGSQEMPGAALLSSLSALRGGSGIVRLLYPKEMECLLAHSPYELIKTPIFFNDPTTALKWMNQAGAVFVGPGSGRKEETSSFLSHVIPQLKVPCVIDADALIAWTTHPFTFPSQTILTPHLGEMRALLESESSLSLTEKTLEECRKFSDTHQITLLLKGAPTFIFHPGEPLMISTAGDPGMATAGAGDVLTGLLAALLSQKLEPKEAALLGVYLHGYAGELAVNKRKSSRGLLASDIIARFGDAFHSME